MPTETERTKADIEALRRAYEIGCGESAEYAAHLAHIAAQRGWPEAAEGASYHLQCKALGLKPWECPPSCTHDDVVGDGYGHKPKEIALRRRLLAAGLSLYEPTPIEALEQVESARRAERSALAKARG